MAIKRMTDLNLAGKRVLIREDLNVPVKDGKVSSDARIRASLPTIKAAKDAGEKIESGYYFASDREHGRKMLSTPPTPSTAKIPSWWNSAIVMVAGASSA